MLIRLQYLYDDDDDENMMMMMMMMMMTVYSVGRVVTNMY